MSEGEAFQRELHRTGEEDLDGLSCSSQSYPVWSCPFLNSKEKTCSVKVINRES